MLFLRHLVPERKRDVELCADVFSRREVDNASHELDDSLRDSKTETGALHTERGVVGLLAERHEDSALFLFRNAHTVVLDGKRQARLLLLEIAANIDYDVP